MRITQEGHQVEDHERVFEILWRYINAEVSIAEPSRTIAGHVPVGYKMWKIEANCKGECVIRNKKFMKEKPKQNFYHL